MPGNASIKTRGLVNTMPKTTQTTLRAEMNVAQHGLRGPDAAERPRVTGAETNLNALPLGTVQLHGAQNNHFDRCPDKMLRAARAMGLNHELAARDLGYWTAIGA